LNAKKKQMSDNEMNQDMSTQDGHSPNPANDQDTAEIIMEGTTQSDMNEATIEHPSNEGQNAKLQAELDKTQDQLVRLSADFDNFRKRTQREKEDWSRYAVQDLLEKLLSVLDGLDQASAAVAQASQEARGLIDGFVMIQRQLLEVLQQEGLKEIPALNEDFDPNVHEAVMQAPPEEGEQDNQVVMVLRKGYMYRDRVLRVSMVKVAKEG
jgi:molecular chaperone GrpE